MTKEQNAKRWLKAQAIWFWWAAVSATAFIFSFLMSYEIAGFFGWLAIINAVTSIACVPLERLTRKKYQ